MKVWFWDICHELKGMFWPDGGARQMLRGPAKSLGLILWGYPLKWIRNVIFHPDFILMLESFQWISKGLCTSLELKDDFIHVKKKKPSSGSTGISPFTGELLMLEKNLFKLLNKNCNHSQSSACDVRLSCFYLFSIMKKLWETVAAIFIHRLKA